MKRINLNIYKTDYYCKSPYSQLSDIIYVFKSISNIREEPHPTLTKTMKEFIGRVVYKKLYSATPRRDY